MGDNGTDNRTIQLLLHSTGQRDEILTKPQAAAQTLDQLEQTKPNSSDGLSNLASQQMAAYAIAQEANKAAIKLNAQLCRDFSIGIQNENGGVFTSPNYPNPYPVDLTCTRLIEGKGDNFYSTVDLHF